MTNHSLHSLFQLDLESQATEILIQERLAHLRRVRGADDAEYVFLKIAAVAFGLIETDQFPVSLEVPSRVSLVEIESMIDTAVRNSRFECLTTFALYSSGKLQSGSVERLKWLPTDTVVKETILAVTRGFAVPEKDKAVRRSLVAARKILKHHSKQLGNENLGVLLGGLESALSNQRLATFDALVTSAISQKRIDSLLEQVNSDEVERLTRILVQIPSAMPNLTPARQSLIQMMSRISPDQRSNDERIWKGLKGFELVQLFSNKGIRSWALGDPQHDLVVSSLSEYVQKASVPEIINILLTLPEFDETQSLSQLTAVLGRTSREGIVLNKIVQALSASAIESTVASIVAKEKIHFDRELQKLEESFASTASQLQREVDRANELETRLRQSIQTKTENSEANYRRVSFEIIRRYVTLGQEISDLAQLNNDSQKLLGSLVPAFISSLQDLGIKRVGAIGQRIESDPGLFDIQGQVGASQITVLQPAYCDTADQTIVYRRGIAVSD